MKLKSRLPLLAPALASVMAMTLAGCASAVTTANCQPGSMCMAKMHRAERPSAFRVSWSPVLPMCMVCE